MRSGEINCLERVSVQTQLGPTLPVTGMSKHITKSCTGTPGLLSLYYYSFTDSSPKLEASIRLLLILVSPFRHEMFWWRIIIMVRKFCIVGVALMFSSTPLFQAWYETSLPCHDMSITET